MPDLTDRSLCVGDCGVGKLTKKKLMYEGCTFHRTINDFMIQGANLRYAHQHHNTPTSTPVHKVLRWAGGDFTNHDGTGGESVFAGNVTFRLPVKLVFHWLFLV